MKITDRDTIKLSDLRPGACAVIVNIDDKGRGIKKRLRDIGFADGEEIKCRFSSIAGDPTAYLIRGCVIALRRADGDCVEVMPVYDTAGDEVYCINKSGGVRANGKQNKSRALR